MKLLLKQMVDHGFIGSAVRHQLGQGDVTVYLFAHVAKQQIQCCVRLMQIRQSVLPAQRTAAQKRNQKLAQINTQQLLCRDRRLIPPYQTMRIRIVQRRCKGIGIFCNNF